MKSIDKSCIPTTWHYDKQMESARLIEIANRIVVGFYSSKGFYLLPANNISYPQRSSVTFPDIDYTKIPRFWKKAKNIDYEHFPIKTGEDFIQEVQQLLEQENYFLVPDYKHLSKSWENLNPLILKFISEYFCSNRNVASLDIYMSNMGSKCTFRLCKEYPAEVKIYLRSDATVYHLLFGLFSSITRNDVLTELKGQWEESQLLVAWILSYTKVADILVQNDIDITPSIKSLKGYQDASLAQASSDFYTKLGLSSNPFIFSYDIKNNIYVNDKRITKLSNREKDILKLLIDKRGNLVSIDALSNLIFKTDDDFSLYVISKSIERLRDKLEKNGIASTFIQTQRGKGYILV